MRTLAASAPTLAALLTSSPPSSSSRLRHNGAPLSAGCTRPPPTLARALPAAIMAAATPPAAAGKLECVLFDIDNTLANSTTLAFGATNKVLELAGYPAISMAQYLEGTKHTTPRRLAWHATGDVEAAVGEELGAQFDDLYIGMVSPETAGFYPGLLLLVEEIAASHRVGALSNACGRYVREVLSANGVSPLFAVQLGADEVPAAKPSPAGLRQCCEAMGLGPEACVYVGDAPSGT